MDGVPQNQRCSTSDVRKIKSFKSTKTSSAVNKRTNHKAGDTAAILIGRSLLMTSSGLPWLDMNINPASSVWLARELKTSARKTVSTHKNALFQKSAPIRARRRDRVTPAGAKTYNRVQRRTTCESVRLVHAARHGDIINRLSPWQRIIYYIISCITSSHVLHHIYRRDQRFRLLSEKLLNSEKNTDFVK